MTVVVTRDVAARFRGFLASCMLEIGPGVYTAPRMTHAVRERVWAVMEEWFGELGGGSIVMTWSDPSLPGGQRIAALGSPHCELGRQDGVYLVRKRAVAEPEREALTSAPTA
jgi:CRISPR-associated protein Cas2